MNTTAQMLLAATTATKITGCPIMVAIENSSLWMDSKLKFRARLDIITAGKIKDYSTVSSIKEYPICVKSGRIKR